MRPDIVVDVGNTRIKWGLCSEECVEQAVSLNPDDESDWINQLQVWYPAGHPCWAVSGVHRRRREAFVSWAKGRGDRVALIDDYRQIPLRIRVEQPERVGIDRLLNGVAALLTKRPKKPCIIVDAGSAVTVDVIDKRNAFCGGAIMPGLRLMAQALHDYTDALPLVKITDPTPLVPAETTETAIESGVLWSVAGGIHALFERIAADWDEIDANLYLTGGDWLLLDKALEEFELPNRLAFVPWPNMTLDGLMLTAEALP